MTPVENHYEFLGLDASASTAEIEAAIESVTVDAVTLVYTSPQRSAELWERIRQMRRDLLATPEGRQVYDDALVRREFLNRDSPSSATAEARTDRTGTLPQLEQTASTTLARPLGGTTTTETGAIEQVTAEAATLKAVPGESGSIGTTTSEMQTEAVEVLPAEVAPDAAAPLEVATVESPGADAAAGASGVSEPTQGRPVTPTPEVGIPTELARPAEHVQSDTAEPVAAGTQRPPAAEAVSALEEVAASTEARAAGTVGGAAGAEELSTTRATSERTSPRKYAILAVAAVAILVAAALLVHSSTASKHPGVVAAKPGQLMATNLLEKGVMHGRKYVSGQRVSISWKGATGASAYQVQMANEQGDPPDTVVFAGKTTTMMARSRRATVKVLGQQLYYWRVRSKIKGVWGPYSVSSHFAVAKPTASPPSHLTARLLSVHGVYSVRLCWSSVRGAAGYRVLVQGQDARTLRSNCSSISVKSGTYWWSVATLVRGIAVYQGPYSSRAELRMQIRHVTTRQPAAHRSSRQRKGTAQKKTGVSYTQSRGVQEVAITSGTTTTEITLQQSWPRPSRPVPARARTH